MARTDPLDDLEWTMNNIDQFVKDNPYYLKKIIIHFYIIINQQHSLTENQSISYDLTKQKGVIKKGLTKRVDEYLKFTNPGGDGVVIGAEHSFRLATGTNRYAPKYIPIDNDRKHLAYEIADGLFEQFKPSFEDSKITPPHMIPYYLDPKLNYSPGLPYLAKLKKRRKLRMLGYEEGLIQQTLNNLRNGIYPNQHYHAFGKSQVVDISKVLAGKDIRTVTAQDLTTYFIDQVVQLKCNKRITWRDTGIGIGIILNQNMVHLFKEMQKFIAEGGVLVEADATAFDSHLNRFPFEGLKRLADYQYLLSAYPDRYITYNTFINNFKNNEFLKDKIVIQHSGHGYTNSGLCILTNNDKQYLSNKNFVVVTSSNRSELIKIKQQLKDTPVNKIIVTDNPDLVPNSVLPYVDKSYTGPKPLLIVAHSGSGKSTFVKEFHEAFIDIDDLLTPA
ncbi:12148_t:CDS:2, partial [Cetraspora pellucida]